MGYRWFGANIPNGVQTPAFWFWEDAEKSFGTKQANKQTPKQNNAKTPHQKLSACEHVFVTAKGLGLQHLSVFGLKPEDSAVFLPKHLK